MRTLLACCLLAGLASGCGGGAPEGRGPNFDPTAGEIVLPPANAALAVRTADRARAAEAPVRRMLPQGTAPGLLVIQDDRNPVGELSASGKVRLSEREFVLRPRDRADITVVFRTPPGMPKIRTLPATGTLNISDRSGPAGVYRQIVLIDPDGMPAFAEVAKAARRPLDVDLGGGLRLVMIAPSRPPSAGAEAVELEVVQGARRLATVPMGTTTTVEAGRRTWIIFPFVSMRETAGDGMGEAGTRYILRAWVTAGYTTRRPRGVSPREQ